MSFKAPKPPRARSQPSSLSNSPSFPSCNFNLVPPIYIPRRRRGYGTKGYVQYRNNEVLAEPLGRIFVQEIQARPQVSRSTAIPRAGSVTDDPFVETADAEPPPLYVLVGGKDPELQRQRQRRKKERQWAKWTNETIPSLLQPYLRILRESDNLRTLNRHSDVTLPACSCDRRVSINVTCVFFERKLLYRQYF